MGINVQMLGAGGDMLKAVYDTDKDDVVDVARLIVEMKALWNLGSFEYSQLFSVAAQDTSPQGLFFKSDGSKMYVVGTENDSVYEYDLAVAWNVSTAVYSQLFSVAAQDTTPQGVFFKSDGSKMYVVGSVNDSVYSYSLAVAWDVTTATPSFSLSIAAQETDPRGLFFKSDGSKMYVVGTENDSVYEYDLAVAWNVSTAVYSQLFSVAAQDTTPQGVFFKSDGSKMYVVGSVNDSVFEYNLAVAWNVSTAVYSQLFSVAAQDTTPQGVFFKSDGSKMYVVGSENDSVYEYVISDDFMRKSIYDINVNNRVDVAAQEINRQPLYLAHNLLALVYKQSLSVADQDLSIRGICFKFDGLKMFIIGDVNDSVFEYNLGTPWDVSTAVYSQYFSVAAQESTPHGLYLTLNGLKMYVVGSVNDSVFEYNLGTPWDVSTAVYSQYFSVAAQDGNPLGLFFKSDGSKMYVVGDVNDSVFEYNLGTPWDVSTAVYSQYFSVASQDTSPRDVFFTLDGLKMFVAGDANDSVFKYNLGTPWDISTAVYSQTFSVADRDTALRDMFWSLDGLKMFVVGDVGNSVYVYSVSPFDY